MGSSRQKEKNGNRSSSKGNNNDGTSARTRPFSFDEIMLRRKSKDEAGENKNNFVVADSVSGKGDSPKMTTDGMEPERYSYDESLPSASRHTSEDNRKSTSRLTDDNVMSDKLARGKNKESRDSEIKSKKSMNKDISNTRLDDSKTDKDCHVQRRKDEEHLDDSRNEIGKRHSRELGRKGRSTNKTDGRDNEERKEKNLDKDGRSYRKRKDVEMPSDAPLNEAEKRHSRNYGRRDSYADRTKEKSESDRRKHRTDDEERNRDKNATEKHSSAKVYEVTRRVESSRSHQEEERPQRRRSRSREYDNDRGRRSHSGSPKGRKQSSHDLRERGELSSRSHLEEERPKRRRSRSQEYDKDRGRRSHSGSPKGRKQPSHDLRERGELTSRSHLEEERPKRRRSRSREYDKEQGRRSHSGSPKGRKQSPHDLRERGELSSHSSKDKSGRSHHDLEKKISSNGSVSHSKRHTESASGLGGYSPRKRKSEAAAKTPPRTDRSPDRKTAGWDLPPASAGSNITSSVSSTVQSSLQSVIPDTYQLSSVVPASSFTTKAAGISYNYLSSSIHAIDSVQLTQATRPMRRLYVENLPNSASEKDILDWINHFLLSSGVNCIQGTQPCISCMIHKEKAQALLEFLTPEDASAALSFDGRSFSGSILKIRRPKDFVEVATGVPQKAVAAPVRIGDSVEDSPHKIFVGGISRSISLEMLMEIAKAFGPLKAFHFQMNSDLEEHCAFLEYVDHSVTLKACAGLNGMKLGGKVLTVVQAVPESALLDKDENAPLYRIPQHAKPLLENPTEVLKLRDVVDANVLLSLSEAELEELLEDIRLECARFGTVRSINAVKQSPSALTSDAAAMETSSMVNVDNMEFTKECDRNDPFSKSPDHKLQVGGLHLPGSDEEEPMETDSAEEAKRCTECTTHISELPTGDSEKAVDVDDALAGDSHSGDKPSEELIKEGTSDLPDGNVSAQETSCQENSEATPGVSPNVCLEREDEYANNSSLVEHLEISSASPVKDATKSEEANVDIEGASEPHFSSKEALDVPKEHEEKREISVNEDVFEPGSVLVEFRRAEAACMAAHCLHGRLFDDRLVTVKYVALDLYRTKFSKQS